MVALLTPEEIPVSGGNTTLKLTHKGALVSNALDGMYLRWTIILYCYYMHVIWVLTNSTIAVQ